MLHRCSGYTSPLGANVVQWKLINRLHRMTAVFKVFHTSTSEIPTWALESEQAILYCDGLLFNSPHLALVWICRSERKYKIQVQTPAGHHTYQGRQCWDGQSCSKLRRRIILLLCLPIESVRSVTQLSRAVLSDLLSSALPWMHTHFWGGCIGKGSSSSSQ